MNELGVLLKRSGVSSKMNGRNRILKGCFLLALLFGLLLTAGCTSGTQSTEDQQPPKQEDISAGLTSFQTKDIYGEEIDQSIFKDYTLTMVNVWGTFCGPCLDEMPFLGELQKEYEPKGVNIVGIVVDVQDQKLDPIEDQISLAKEIAEETGADYTHLILSEEMIDSVLNQFDSIPTSFFVDSEGNIVSEFYIGSRDKDKWVDIIETNIKEQK